MSEALDWQQLIETALTLPGNLASHYNRFYEYSFLNQLLLLSQGVIEPVATYKRWQELGRQVLKGSKAKEIVRPIVIEKKDEAGDVEERRLHFKAVRCIFGLSETAGEELPAPELPTWDMDRALSTLNIRRVPFYNLNGNVQGYSVGREFALNPIAARPLKTTMHELGHIVLGHTDGTNAAEYATHRGVTEFQAEATAYLTMNELEQLTDVEASESRGYLQHWLRGERPPDPAIRQVFKATDVILKAGRPTAAVAE